MNPIRVLQIVPAMNCGGMENFIMNVYRNIDRQKVQFDFLYHYDMDCFFDKEIEKLGGKTYKLTGRQDNNFPKYFKNLDDFFKEHTEYKVVHGHYSGFGMFYNHYAKKHGVATRAGHSHNAFHESNLTGYADGILSTTFKYNLTDRFACSEKAGDFLFGKKPFEVIKNGIDIKRFAFDEKKRAEARRELEIKDELVIGHIGRFSQAKNHTFIVDIFNEIVKSKPASILLLAGEGELMAGTKKKAEEYGIGEKVKFLGVRRDTDRLLCAMDAFLYPSIFEGLPVSCIEAQTSGVPCFFSDNITSEVQICDKTVFFSLDKSPTLWAESLLKSEAGDRTIGALDAVKAGYDIVESTKRLQNFYIEKSV